MGIRIEDLPEDTARRVRAEIARQEGKPPPDKRSATPGGKYGAVKERRGNIVFDSRKEARRYDALVLLLKAGEIADLRIQPEFTLLEAYTTPDGERVKSMKYRADFSYRENGVLVVEDVKSTATRTRTYLDKRKLMREIHGIDVREVQDW